MNTIFTRRTLFNFSLLSFLLLAPSPVQAQKPARKGGGLKHAQAILGKPLSAAQKKAVRAANAKRQQKIKPIQEEYRSTVARALGLTVAQYKEREDKLRPQNKKGQ